MPFSIDEAKKTEFAALYLLQRLAKGARVPVYLEGDDTFLDPILSFLMAASAVDIPEQKEELFYEVTTKGRQILQRFVARYYDYLKHYDIYCAVDLGAGEFAFEDYFEWDHEDPEDEQDWLSYLNEERWSDLRVTVAVYKGLNPIEIVFMNYVTENRFGEDKMGWQFDLMLGSIWNEIIDVCNDAITVDELAYTNDEGRTISGENVIQDVIREGAKLSLKLAKEEESQESEDSETPFDDESYRNYFDPDYVANPWHATMFNVT